ncbi:hypothetical protein KRMM14A1259_48410 [Krasilnikovia sp. MM14-A1259]
MTATAAQGTMTQMKEELAPEALVEAGWQAVRDDGRVRAELLEAAYAETRLRPVSPSPYAASTHPAG